jgi:hypothetical protein
MRRLEILGSAVLFCHFDVLVFIFVSLSQSCLFVGLWRCLDVVGSSVLLCQELGGVTVTNGMWNKYNMTPSVAINATQLIAIEAATVRQRVNTGTAVHAHNIFLRHLGTFITNTMVCCKLVFLNVVLSTVLVGRP